MPSEPQVKPETAELQEAAKERESLGQLGCLLVLACIAALVVANVPPARQFFFTWWLWILPSVAAVVAAVLLYRPFRAFLLRATVTRRAGLFVFVVLAIVVFGVFSPILLQGNNQAIAARSIFLLVVCLLPAVMYYLFIATRKYGLLNEFVTNLERLGLLATNGNSAGTLRVLTYLRKFEAVYGPIGEELVDQVLQARDPLVVVSKPDWSRRTAASIANIFTAETTPPLVISTILIALGWLLVLPPIPTLQIASTVGIATNQPQSPTLLATLLPIQGPVQFAFLGAYFFIVQMLFRRYVRRDLRASAYMQVANRIVIAVIAAWVLQVVWDALQGLQNPITFVPNFNLELEQQSVVAFAIGVFPPILWQFLAALFKRITFAGVVLPSVTATLPLSDLDGLTVWHESRLEEEDIENIPNMATANVVELMLNTRFPSDRIIDWVDQAILYTLLGAEQKDTRRHKLRVNGIRTATGLQEAYHQAQQDLPAFEKILDEANGGRSGLRGLMDVMETNPNLALIRIWKGLLPHQTRPELRISNLPSATRAHTEEDGSGVTR